MHYVMIAVGSAGDVLPLIEIGRNLRRRRHQVTLIANTCFRERTEQDGLSFVPLSTEEACQVALEDKWILTTRYSAVFWQRHAVAWNATIYRLLINLDPSTLVILTTDRPNVWADLAIHREMDVPAFRLVLDLPALSGCAPLEGNGKVEGVQHALEQRWQEQWRIEARVLGLHVGNAHVPRLFRSTRARVPTIALWPGGFVPEIGAAQGVHKVGFILPANSKPRTGAAPMAVLGSGHVVFCLGTEGTTRVWHKRFIEESAKICTRLLCRGIVLGGGDIDSSERHLPSHLEWKVFEPLSVSLVGARAVVHHGGIGTAAAAIAHGVPQLILPRVFMQPVNAEWLRRLGVCTVLDPREYNSDSGVWHINKMVFSHNYTMRALELAGQTDFCADMGYLCEVLETKSASFRSTRLLSVRCRGT